VEGPVANLNSRNIVSIVTKSSNKDKGSKALNMRKVVGRISITRITIGSRS